MTLNAEKIGKKIRDAEVRKIPFMIIVGEKEQSENKVSVRKHGSGDLGTFSLEGFTEIVNNEISKNFASVEA